MDDELAKISNKKVSDMLSEAGGIKGGECMLEPRHDRSVELARVDAALERLEDGSFGICKGCTGPIEIERLTFDPSTLFCRGCEQ